ncbi:MAG: hypothetical protein M1833_005936 [Piccolia ochrophora]|nr:MAG: hypothetical protein M1833_005936 [Piccolia ochrophora]
MQPFRLLSRQVLLRGIQRRHPKAHFTFSPAGFSTSSLLSSSSPLSSSKFRTNIFRQVLFRRIESPFLRNVRSKRFNKSNHSPSPNPTPNLGSPKPSLSLTQRFRKLSREYGWSALGVYLFLTALDFPFCFLAVRSLGTERIGHWEHVAVEWFWRIVPWPAQDASSDVKEVIGEPEGKADNVVAIAEPGWGLEEAEERNRRSDASIWTQLALAYAVHKSFIFIRVPLTAAVTPKVVKVLRGWGWDIGKRRPKVPKTE